MISSLQREQVMKPKKIVVVGIGYVGLPLAVLLAQRHWVTLVDIVKEKVELVNQNISPIKEAYLEKYMQTKQLHLTATVDGGKAYEDAEIVIVAVHTQYDPYLNGFDCSAVDSVISQVICVNPSATIVIKSTVPVGYTSETRAKYESNNILFSPEFLRETHALYDNLHPSRIIVSCDESCRQRAETFMEIMKECSLEEDVPALFMGFKEAEAVKLFANTYLALRVSYFNELDTYAESNHLDASAIISGVCFDPRIGNHYNNPSFGYGGYCLPKDTKQLLANYESIPQNMMTAIVAANQTRKDYIAGQIIKMVNTIDAAKNGDGLADHGVIVGIFPLTMKTDSDNFRQSSVPGVIQRLLAENIHVVIYEPTVAEGSKFLECPVITSLDEFKRISGIIIANRYDRCLDDVSEKVYTRDLFGRD